MAAAAVLYFVGSEIFTSAEMAPDPHLSLNSRLTRIYL